LKQLKWTWFTNDNSVNTDDILLKAASVEQLSSHPAAQALIQKAEERKLGRLPIVLFSTDGLGDANWRVPFLFGWLE
jgi:cation transport ATPase